MAFEDRCSPNQANSPGPVSNGVPSSGPESPTSPNPNERNLKPYTCTTVPKYEKSKSPSLRMSPNLAYVKPQPVSPVETSPVNGVHPSVMYNPYYNPYLLNAIPMHPEYLRLYQHNPMLPPVDMKPLFLRQDPLRKTPPRGDIDPEQENEDVTEDQEHLHFSISNILKPEFGLNAIRKTTNKKEGPKPGGPVHSILYKPYDLTKNTLESKSLENSSSHLPSRSSIENNKSLLDRRSEYIQSRSSSFHESPFKSAPLGNLCNTVSQIGTSKPFPPKNSLNFSSNQNGLKSDGNKSLSSFQTSSRDDYRRPDSANSSISTSSSNVSSQQGQTNGSEDGQSKMSSTEGSGNSQWPAWVFCTRYSDRPSSGPRSRRSKKKPTSAPTPEDKRPRTAFSSAQLARLKHEFAENRYLNERRRQQLSGELGLNEAQIKIWFQNKRAKIKKSTGQKNPLALQLMAQGLYNHGTASCSEGEDDDISVA